MRFAQVFGILVSVAGIANGLNARIPEGDTEVGLQQRSEEAVPPSLPAALRDEDENQVPGIHLQRAAAKVQVTSKTATSKTATSTAAVATKISQTSSATTAKATGTTLSTVTTSHTSSSPGVAISTAAGASKTCAAKAARALRSLRRSDSTSSDPDSYISEDGEASMGQKKHLPKSEQVAAVGINGCSALFIFGSASREFAHLAAGSETAEASAAAREAISENVVEDGAVITISIRSPDQAMANSVKSSVQTTLQSKNAQITWDVSTYPHSETTRACYEFTAAANSNTVTTQSFMY